jgi:hypothetical protein|tara:strand:+ start:9911 stop:10351 length:441 start_codon:yes stop_codon:yes gene_type:complete
MGMDNAHNDTNPEFLVIGQNMERVTTIYGAFLIVWGVAVSTISGSGSITSLIPSMIGLPMVILGITSSLLPKTKKMLMHIAVLIGLFAFIGGADFFRGFSSAEGAFSNPWAAISKLMLFTTGFVFTILCVKSFIFVRKNREVTRSE